MVSAKTITDTVQTGNSKLHLDFMTNGEKMSSLYELTTFHQALLEMLEDEDVDQQTVMDTLEAVDGEIEAKSEGYVYIVRQMEADLQAVTTEYERFKEKKEHLVKSAHEVDRYSML